MDIIATRHFSPASVPGRLGVSTTPITQGENTDASRDLNLLRAVRGAYETGGYEIAAYPCAAPALRRAAAQGHVIIDRSVAVLTYSGLAELAGHSGTRHADRGAGLRGM